MFKRGVITDEISQDFKIAAQLAAKYGLDGVEIRSVWEKGPHELTQNDIQVIKDILFAHNLEVCGISSPFYKCDINSEDEIAENIEILKRSIELAQKLGTDIVRGFTFWRNGDFEEYLPKIVSNFEKPLEILQKNNITLALEFDPSVFGTNAKKVVRIIEEINSPLIKGLWDPGNDLWDPDGEIPFPDGYEIIKPYLVHMHLKDGTKKKDGSTVAAPIAKGDVDYIGQFKELIKSGYDGYVVLETHYRSQHNIDEELLALPKGSAFSYLGYEATEESLINWNNLMMNIANDTDE